MDEVGTGKSVSQSPRPSLGPTAAPAGNPLLASDVIFERTPGTRAEGERIGKLLGVQPWLAAEARKDRLLGCGAPRVLYLATPVWFLPDPKQDIAGNPELKVGSALTNMVETRHENPLCHSFVALDVAN